MRIVAGLWGGERLVGCARAIGQRGKGVKEGVSVGGGRSGQRLMVCLSSEGGGRERRQGTELLAAAVTALNWLRLLHRP